MEDLETVVADMVRAMEEMSKAHYGLYIMTAEAHIKMCKQKEKLQRELETLFRKYVELSNIDPRLREVAECIDNALGALPDDYDVRR